MDGVWLTAAAGVVAVSTWLRIYAIPFSLFNQCFYSIRSCQLWKITCLCRWILFVRLLNQTMNVIFGQQNGTLDCFHRCIDFIARIMKFPSVTFHGCHTNLVKVRLWIYELPFLYNFIKEFKWKSYQLNLS